MDADISWVFSVKKDDTSRLAGGVGPSCFHGAFKEFSIYFEDYRFSSL